MPNGSANPLAELTPQQLWNLEILLDLACNRRHGGVRDKRRQYFCLIGRSILLELDLRGLPHPPMPHRYGDLIPNAL